MVFLVDPKDISGNAKCQFFCKWVAYPMYGIDPCNSFYM